VRDLPEDRDNKLSILADMAKRLVPLLKELPPAVLSDVLKGVFARAAVVLGEIDDPHPTYHTYDLSDAQDAEKFDVILELSYQNLCVHICEVLEVADYAPSKDFWLEQLLKLGYVQYDSAVSTQARVAVTTITLRSPFS
jgi:hypothetical protein